MASNQKMKIPKSEVDKTTFRYLHELANSLNILLASLDRTLSYLGPLEHFGTANIATLDISSVLRTPTNALMRSLEHFIADFETKQEVGQEPGLQKATLAEDLQRGRISLVQTLEASSNFSPVLIQDSLAGLKLAIKQIADSEVKYHKEALKTLTASIREVERIITVFHLKNSMETTGAIRKKMVARLSQTPSRLTNESGAFNAIVAIKACMDKIKPQADFYRIKLKFSDRVGTAIPNVDLDKFQSCMNNLLDNAVKYTGALRAGSEYDSTWITVRAEWLSREYFQIEVESWGTPITHEEHSERLMFKEGYRGFFARKLAIAGSGTGLADVKMFIEASGGEVEYVTNPISKNSDVYTAIKTTLKVKLKASREM